MKAITLTQPWATLVAIGAKVIETRSWNTYYRGPLAIHAAKAFPRDAQLFAATEPVYGCLRRAGAYLTDLPLGAVVATACLIDVMKIPAEPLLTTAMHADSGEAFTVMLLPPPELHRERLFGDYTPGRYAWLLGDVKRLDRPVPARGALGLWEWACPA